MTFMFHIRNLLHSHGHAISSIRQMPRAVSHIRQIPSATSCIKQTIFSTCRRSDHYSWSVLNSLHKTLTTPRRSFSTQPDVLCVDNHKLKNYLKHLEQKFEDAERKNMLQENDMTREELRDVHTTITTLGPIVYQFRKHYVKKKELEEFDELIKDLEAKEDTETIEMARLEQAECQEEAHDLEQMLLDQLLPAERLDDLDAIMEVSCGVGGQEAMIFTSEMFTMYENFSRYIGWDFEVISFDENEAGHLRKASALISGEKVYSILKYEGGVHRVQRVPKTEKSGRVHTSTMSVAILPRPTEVDVSLEPGDVEVETFCAASGPGGQNVNRTHSAVRVRHIPTGTTVQCIASRSQIKNKDIAMQMLRSKIYEAEIEKDNQNRRSQRKLQVGSRGRSEKIRTYNFLQDRVTEHRIGISLHNITGFMEGGEQLEDLLAQLQEESRRERLAELLDDFAEQTAREEVSGGAQSTGEKIIEKSVD